MVWDLVGLFAVRGWVLIATTWGLLVMYRLYRRGTQLDFPIVPPPIVKLTAVFLLTCLVTTVWITVGFFLGDPWDDTQSAASLSALERTIYGSSLIYSLSCTLWIINVGIKGYRHGPKVDEVVLEAIVRGMVEKTPVEPPEEVS